MTITIILKIIYYDSSNGDTGSNFDTNNNSNDCHSKIYSSTKIDDNGDNSSKNKFFLIVILNIFLHG